MNKIPTLFVRDEQDRRYVTPVVTPGCEWVLADEGIATRKYDGTCVMFDGVSWWARREVKAGKDAPPNWQAVDLDLTTGKAVGWEPIEQSSFAKYHAEALAQNTHAMSEGTYELIGPKINGNPEQASRHLLVAHANAEQVRPFGLTFSAIRDTILVFGAQGMEGLVWHHPDGRMTKIKRRDFPR